MTTVQPEGDPAFLAYDRARRYSEDTLRQGGQRTKNRLTQDQELKGFGYMQEQEQRTRDNTNGYRDSGFTRSGLEFRDRDRILADIANRKGLDLVNYQRGMEDADTSVAEGLARLRMEAEEQALAARARLAQQYASAGASV